MIELITYRKNNKIKMSTGFVGFLLQETETLNDFRNVLIRYFGKKFKPQQYLHTTMIYLANSYINDTEKLLRDDNFSNEINKFKNAVCFFDKLQFIGNSLILVYKFENPKLADILANLTNKYERNRHSQYLHITIGSFSFDAKKTFQENYNTIVGNMLDDFTFTIEAPTVISVDSEKKYCKYRDLQQ